jgi:tetratricopeptide (TPR) repeat protein
LASDGRSRQGALQDQDTAVKLGDDEIAYFLRAETLRYRGDLERALADYDHFLAIHPIQIPAMVGRALAFEKMGNIAQAKAEFEKALNTESPFSTAKVEAAGPRNGWRATGGLCLRRFSAGDSACAGQGDVRDVHSNARIGCTDPADTGQDSIPRGGDTRTEPARGAGDRQLGL